VDESGEHVMDIIGRQPIVLTIIWVTGGATIAFFITVILSGVLSALVTLGVLEVFGRRTLQKNLMVRFLSDGGRSGFGSLETDTLAKLVGMTPDVLFSLQYRQLCGQIMAAINNEGAAATEMESPSSTPLLDYLSGLYNRGPVSRELPSRAKLEQAVREVDHLQAFLGERISSTVYGIVLTIWFVIYTAVSLVVILNSNQSIWPSVITVLLGLLLGGILAFATAIVSGILFVWLDRLIALK
jgi:hypothetical protein